jgi:hypothetical protein
VRLLESGHKDKLDLPRSEAKNVYAHVALHRQDCGANAAPCVVKYHTEQGTATEGADYFGIKKDSPEGEVIFEAGETQKVIKVEIVDDDDFEDDEVFDIVIDSIDGVERNEVIERGTVRFPL